MDLERETGCLLNGDCFTRGDWKKYGKNCPKSPDQKA